MRGTLETIVGAMFAGKTSELLKRILWAEHQNKKIIVIKPNIDSRYSQEKIITCFPIFFTFIRDSYKSISPENKTKIA